MTEQQIADLDARYEHLKTIEPIIAAENKRIQVILDICTVLEVFEFPVQYPSE